MRPWLLPCERVRAGMGIAATIRPALVASLMLAAAEGLAVADSNPEDGDEIVLAAKNFFDFSRIGLGDVVRISGTLTGEGLGYKNNTVSINCIRDRQECFIASIEQIGPNQMSRLEYAHTYPITKWNAFEIVATEETSEISCSKTTITIERQSQTALWIQEPINQTRPLCLKSDTKIYKWTIEDSPGWKRIFRKK